MSYSAKNSKFVKLTWSYSSIGKVAWEISTCLLGKERQGLTSYVETCKGCLSNQDIPSEKSGALDSQPMLEHAKVVWAIRTSLLRNQRHWTHSLCWNMQRLFEYWSEMQVIIKCTYLLDNFKYNFHQQNPSSMAQLTFCTSLVSKHISIFNLVQSSTYILHLGSEHSNSNRSKHTFYNPCQTYSQNYNKYLHLRSENEYN